MGARLRAPHTRPGPSDMSWEIAVQRFGCASSRPSCSKVTSEWAASARGHQHCLGAHDLLTSLPLRSHPSMTRGDLHLLDACLRCSELRAQGRGTPPGCPLLRPFAVSLTTREQATPWTRIRSVVDSGSLYEQPLRNSPRSQRIRSDSLAACNLSGAKPGSCCAIVCRVYTCVLPASTLWVRAVARSTVRSVPSFCITSDQASCA